MHSDDTRGSWSQLLNIETMAMKHQRMSMDQKKRLIFCSKHYAEPPKLLDSQSMIRCLLSIPFPLFLFSIFSIFSILCSLFSMFSIFYFLCSLCGIPFSLSAILAILYFPLFSIFYVLYI